MAGISRRKSFSQRLRAKPCPCPSLATTAKKSESSTSIKTQLLFPNQNRRLQKRMGMVSVASPRIEGGADNAPGTLEKLCTFALAYIR
jgi:hypothetical protein